MHQWDAGPHAGAKTQELLLRLDHTDGLVAASLAQGPEYKPAMAVEITGNVGPKRQEDSNFAGFSAPSG
eukprot:2821408-Karenia_brevis.AAC.1